MLLNDVRGVIWEGGNYTAWLALRVCLVWSAIVATHCSLINVLTLTYMAKSLIIFSFKTCLGPWVVNVHRWVLCTSATGKLWTSYEMWRQFSVTPRVRKHKLQWDGLETDSVCKMKWSAVHFVHVHDLLCLTPVFSAAINASINWIAPNFSLLLNANVMDAIRSIFTPAAVVVANVLCISASYKKSACMPKMSNKLINCWMAKQWQ